MGKYLNYRELMEHEKQDRDFRIDFKNGRSKIVVMAPHGGSIEPGTTEIAEAVAGGEHSFYSFTGLKKKENRNLHLTSGRFDEPTGIRMAADAETILSVHGFKAKDQVVYIGGRDMALRKKIANAIMNARFSVRESPKYPGKNPLNICNRNRQGRGVQLEISLGLRLTMFLNLANTSRKSTTVQFDKFVSAVKEALSTCL
ncbi:poly-gamma-glutamate hydrolase family protein [Thermodesulfobacteriota bacterium]